MIARLGLTGKFHILGYRSNVTAVYQALDVFVLPSRKPEPFGRVTVEAMMQGRPVIATNHGGTCELIQDKVSGLLVPPSDPESLANAIELLLRRVFGERLALENAVRRWAIVDANANAAVQAIDKRRMSYVEGLLRTAGVTSDDARLRAQILYWAYLGFALSDRSLSAAQQRAIVQEMLRMALP